MPGLIEQYAISEDERILQVERVRNLIKIYQKGNLTKSDIEQVFAEWKTLAERLRKGEDLIEEMKSRGSATLENNPHYLSLTHLYEVLVQIIGIYSGFFQTMFIDRPDLYDKAQQKILDILLPSKKKDT
jgi:hypothetical protein